APDSATWGSATVPGAPGRPPHTMTLVRARAPLGRLLCVWSWGGAVRSVHPFGDSFRVARLDGIVDTHEQTRAGWQIQFSGALGREVVELGRITELVAQQSAAP